MKAAEQAIEIQHCRNVQCVRHLHLEAEFIFVNHGTVHVLQSHGSTVLNEGEGFYLAPLEIHGFCTPDISQCTILIFPTDLVPEFAITRPFSRPFALSPFLGDTVSHLEASTHQDLLHARAVLYPLCCEILDNCAHTACDYTEVGALGRVEQYIWDHLASPLSLKSVAAATGYNPSYLSRTFHRAKGVGYLEYINMLRCYRAVRLMSSSESLSVSEIAYQVGFESIRTFNRVFLQRYGMTPTQMKQQRTVSMPKG